MTSKVGAAAVIGSGSWGTALAVQLGRSGVGVGLWGPAPALARAIAGTRENRRYLPDVALPAGVLATADHAEALDGSSLVVLAVPSHFLRGVLQPMAAAVPSGSVLLSATKGLEPSSALRMSELLSQLVPGRAVAVLSGPSCAREVAVGLPTALVVASTEATVARTLQEGLSAP